MKKKFFAGLAKKKDIITKVLKQTIGTAILVLGIAHSVYAIPLLTDWINATCDSAHGTLESVSVTLSAFSNTIYTGMWNLFPGSGVYEGFSGFSDPSIYNPAIASTDVINVLGELGTEGFDYTVVFDAPVKNPVLYIASLASTLKFDPAVSLTKISGENVFTVSGNTVAGVTDDIKAQPNNDANGIIQLNGIFTSFGFNAIYDYPTGIPHDGITIQIGGNVAQSPVPEPSTMLLLGIGIAVLTGIKRRRKRH